MVSLQLQAVPDNSLFSVDLPALHHSVKMGNTDRDLAENCLHGQTFLLYLMMYC